MKAKSITMVVFCFLFFNLKAQTDKSAINVSIGLPITKETSLQVGKYSSKVAYYTNLYTHFNACIGFNYDKINLSPSINQFTYDREYIGGYIGINYQFNISEKIRFCPEFNVGYSIVNYWLNEFEIEKQKTSGFLVTGGFKFNYKINNKIGLNLGCFSTTLLKELNTKIDFPIPANYITIPQKRQNNLSVEFGLMIEI